MAASAVLGLGRYLPTRVVTNDELAGELGVPAALLTERSGIAQRHYAEPGNAPSDLARDAAVAALAAAGLEAADVDLIVFATMTPDIPFPGSGCFLQDKLRCRTVGAIDVRAQCAGFLFALATADRFIRAGAAQRVLVAGAEVHSTALDASPRAAEITPVFGDGAGVFLLGPADEPGVLSTVLHSDPEGFERFWCEFPASRHYPSRFERAQLEAGLHFYRLDAAAIHAQAERALVEVTGEALERARVRPEQVALYVMNYLDPRVARRAAITAGAPQARIVASAEAAGHMAAAGIPVAISAAVDAGRVGRGDLVCCAAFGAGMSWAGTVLRL